MYGIRKSVLGLNTSTYARENHLPKDLSGFIDCAAGINPLGFSEKIKIALRDIPGEIINLYPECNIDIKTAIIKFWMDLVELRDDQIILGDGSIELIYKINKLFVDKGSRVLGYSPQFSAYIDDIRSYGAIYENYLMNMENNFEFDADLFLEKMSKDHRLFYIDNPNNPTGQIIHIESIERIVKKAYELGVVIIIDEAYGDFMDKGNSATKLINKYNNLLVLRTFSKGLGLAGVRAGYMITSNKLTREYLKISNPYEMSGIARYLGAVALEDEDFINESIKIMSLYKERFINSLRKLTVLKTDMPVPIMTLKHPDPQVDLEELLLKNKIISVSGRGFIGLGRNFVRIRICEDIDLLIEAFKYVEKENFDGP